MLGACERDGRRTSRLSADAAAGCLCSGTGGSHLWPWRWRLAKDPRDGRCRAEDGRPEVAKERRTGGRVDESGVEGHLALRRREGRSGGRVGWKRKASMTRTLGASGLCEVVRSR